MPPQTQLCLSMPGIQGKPIYCDGFDDDDDAITLSSVFSGSEAAPRAPREHFGEDHGLLQSRWSGEPHLASKDFSCSKGGASTAIKMISCLHHMPTCPQRRSSIYGASIDGHCHGSCIDGSSPHDPGHEEDVGEFWVRQNVDQRHQQQHYHMAKRPSRACDMPTCPRRRESICSSGSIHYRHAAAGKEVDFCFHRTEGDREEEPVAVKKRTSFDSIQVPRVGEIA